MSKNSTNLLKTPRYLLLLLTITLGSTLSLNAQGTSADSCNANIIIEYDSSGVWATLRVQHSGSPNSSIIWGNNLTTDQIQVDLTGEYCVTVVTETGCSVTKCEYIQLSGPTCQTYVSQETLTDGSYSLSVVSNGMTGNYYTWSNGSSEESIIPTTSGTYCVTVTDATGCASDACFFIDVPGQPENCEVVLYSYPDTLNGGAFVGVDPSGVGPFTYSWNDGSVESFIDVPSNGEYCVTVVDANGCVAESCKMIEIAPIPCHIAAELYSLDPTNSGEVEIHIATEINDLTIVWDNGTDASFLVVTESKEYCVTITEPAGCSVVRCIYIEVPPVTPDSCQSWIMTELLADGSYRLFIESQGIAPFQYIWNDAGTNSGTTSYDYIASVTGEYCVTVYDNNGCVSTACIYVDVAPIDPDTCSSWIVKELLDDGTYKLSVESAGVAPFNFSWNQSDAAGQVNTNNHIIATETGEYCIVVYDALQCRSEVCVYVEITPVDPDTCYSWIVKELLDDGTYKLRVEYGGVAPFNFSWNQSDVAGQVNTNDHLIATETGEYCIVVYDALQCRSEVCVYVEITPVDPDTCNSWIVKELLDDGTYKLRVESEGVAPFYYTWNHGDVTGTVNTDEYIIASETGEYCVIVYDAHQCRTEVCINVEVTPIEPDSCESWIVKELLDDGTYKLRVETQGVAPFYYSWNQGDATGAVNTNDHLIATETGEYCVTVYDARQCESKVCIYVEITPVDPDTCYSWIEKELLDDGTYKIFVQTSGVAPFSYGWNDSATGTVDVQYLHVTETGEYCVRVVDDRNCVSEVCIYIEIPTDPNLCGLEVLSSTYASDYVVELKAEPRGEAPFEYYWSDGSNGNAIEVHISGEYCVKVIDADGCIAEKCVQVDVPQRPCSVEITRGSNSAGTEIVLEAHSDGVHPLTYYWNNNSTDQRIVATESGSYCVKIIDANGCEATKCIDIEVQPICHAEIHKGDGSTSEEIKLEAHSDGVHPLTYHWSTNSEDAAIKVSETGEYCVKIIDAVGCESYACVYVEIENPICETNIEKGPNSTSYLVVLEANPSGVGPFAFYWEDGSDGSLLVVQESGEYCVKVIDARGCESYACKYVEVEAPVCESKTYVVEQNDLEAKLGVETDGHGPFAYYWDNGEVSQYIIVSKSGEYCVEVIDDLGCISYSCVLVEIQDYVGCETKIELIANADSSEFKIIAHSSGVGPFEYSWSQGDTDRYFYPDLDGEYCVKVIDANGCISEACLKVEGVTPTIDLSAYPNPAPSGEFHIVIDSELEFEALVEVRDINGNMLYTTTISVNEGIQSLNFSNDEFPVGVFFVNIIRGSNIETIRVVKMGD